MPVKVIRLLFVLSCLLMGGVWALYAMSSPEAPGSIDFDNLWPWGAFGGAAGVLTALGVLLLLRFVTQEVFERLSPALVAVVLALVTGFTLGRWIIDMHFPEADAAFKTFIVTSLVLIFGFIGISLGLTRASNWETLVRAVHRRTFAGNSPKVVDTSVIIDGRIADVCKTGFLEGTLLVPRFVLQELQHIADSSDILRRARGRRGLDILKALQEPDSKVGVSVVEDNPVEIEEVDGKLVRVANDYGARIITNDLNLNKVAQIEGVEVLNINDLANALKPAVLPDELMQVKVIKEGKEAFQGVGYLDDGTMVVVDGGKDYVGKDVAVVVTSVLQTSAGRMIFTKLQNLAS